MACNRRSARTIEPEFFTRLFRDGHKTLARARVRHAHNLGGGLCNGVFIVANNITNQHHFGQIATAAFGRITHRTQITFVQMLQTRQRRARCFGGFKQVIFDFDNRRNRFTGLAEELKAHRARVFRHFVQDPARTGDEAIATLFLHARQAR